MIYRHRLQFDRENCGIYTFIVNTEIKQGNEFIPGDALGTVSFSRDGKFIDEVNPEVRQALNEFIGLAYDAYMRKNGICCIDNIPTDQRWLIVYDVFVQIAENQTAGVFDSVYTDCDTAIEEDGGECLA